MTTDEHHVYLEILGLQAGASLEEVRAAYRQHVLRYHPDHNPDDPYAARRFAVIQEAYEVLCEPQRHKQRGAFHTPISAFLTIRSQRTTVRRDNAVSMSDSFLPVIGMATVFYLALMVMILLMSIGLDPSSVGPTDAKPGEALVASGSEGMLIGVFLCTVVYGAFLALVLSADRAR